MLIFYYKFVCFKFIYAGDCFLFFEKQKIFCGGGDDGDGGVVIVILIQVISMLLMFK